MGLPRVRTSARRTLVTLAHPLRHRCLKPRLCAVISYDVNGTTRPEPTRRVRPPSRIGECRRSLPMGVAESQRMGEDVNGCSAVAVNVVARLAHDVYFFASHGHGGFGVRALMTITTTAQM